MGTSVLKVRATPTGNSAIHEKSTALSELESMVRKGNLFNGLV